MLWTQAVAVQTEHAKTTGICGSERLCFAADVDETHAIAERGQDRLAHQAGIADLSEQAGAEVVTI